MKERSACGLLALFLPGLLLAACGGDAANSPFDSSGRDIAQLERKVDAERARTSRLARSLRQRRGTATAQPEAMPSASTTREPASGPSPAVGLLSPNAEADFRALEREIGGVSGLAVSAVGRGRPVSVVGSLRTGVAWSTIKVPLAIAARDGEAASSVTAAITASDNAAAEALWTSLGDSASAGAAVEAVLAAGGDGKTRVQIDRVRPEFTPFGQTEWPLESQQHFVAGLPCLPEAATVLELMGKVVADQRWAIGAASAGARFKGGWGPGPDGRYLVRQMGIVTLPGGQLLALSIANVPSDGSLSTGSANLTRIAQWAMDHVPPAGLSAAPAC